MLGTGLVLAASAAAQQSHSVPLQGSPPAVVMPPEKSAVELMTGFGSYDAGYGVARSYSLRGIQVTDFGVLQEEALRQSRFGFSGSYGDISLTHDLSPDNYMMVGVGAGGSLLFPEARIDLAGYQKFGAQRQYVVGLGTYFAEGNQAGRSDKGLVLSGIYYGNGFVLEGGLRGNVANPGNAFGPSEYLAATFGSDDRRAIVVRLEHAKETYQILTTGTQKVDYMSNSISVQWHERITRGSLLIIGLGYYKNPSYSDKSINIGWRWSFR
ncbi:YaiO family outer membrane beta-barrel protein [Bordetella sp. FB-8]|uniref:YaiO family outer membrane beta-barrel protein n=1 Tax=Bordetella sp. FB-8 TaxID=1159870 RepID=UPI001E5442BB|nr:YaiO family outer membrane beta-barrel protein [Bordetella sp. FB-8]